jgi:hypothetical protein
MNSSLYVFIYLRNYHISWYDSLFIMSTPTWTPWCPIQRIEHRPLAQFCPYCGAANPGAPTPTVDLTGSSPIARPLTIAPLRRTNALPIAEAAREAANQRIRKNTAAAARPHSGQTMTIGGRLPLPTAPRPRTNSRQSLGQQLQAFYPIAVTLVEEPWEYISMEDKENGKATMMERTIAGI